MKVSNRDLYVIVPLVARHVRATPGDYRAGEALNRLLAACQRRGLRALLAQVERDLGLERGEAGGRDEYGPGV